MENTVGQSLNVQVPQNAQVPQSVITPGVQVSQNSPAVQNVPQNNLNPQNVPTPQSVTAPGSGVHIQIFNPSVAAPGACLPASSINTTNNYSTMPCYPANYYTQNFAQPVQTAKPEEAAESEKKKTKKREIVQLTDDYIKSLETYLNNQDKQVRLIGAKDVLARLQEDPERKNDAALNALINKMLQDPYQPVRFIAMAALEAGNAKGNRQSIELLKGIQTKNTKEHSPMHQEDALKASNVLLKISGNTIEKEFEVKDNKEKKSEKE